VRISMAQFSCVLYSAFGLLVAPSVAARAANLMARSDILATLRHSHPRLYLLDSDLPQVKKAIALDPVIKCRWESLTC